MHLSPEEISAAVKVQTFVRAYERNHRQGLWINCLTLPMLLVSALREITSGHTAVGYSMLGFTFGLGFFFVLIIPIQRKRYEQESTILRILEREHRDDLPWIKEEEVMAEAEKHLAAVKQIEQELAKKAVTP